LTTDADVARYGLAYRVIEGLMVLPGYVMLALFPMIARNEDDHGRLAAFIGTALAGLEAIALPVAAMVAIFSPQLMVLLGGPKYAAAAPVLAILAVALGLSYVAGVFGNALMALGRQRTLFWLGIGPLAVNLVANLALIPPLGTNGAAIAVVASEVVGLLLVRGFYVRVAGPPVPPPHLKILLAGSGLAVLAAVKFALPLSGRPLLTLVVGGLLGTLVYSALLLRLGALPEPIMDRLPLPTWLVRTFPRA
jgi:O-antigen/teichoic acid export membrane protein